MDPAALNLALKVWKDNIVLLSRAIEAAKKHLENHETGGNQSYLNRIEVYEDTVGKALVMAADLQPLVGLVSDKEVEADVTQRLVRLNELVKYVKTDAQQMVAELHGVDVTSDRGTIH